MEIKVLASGSDGNCYIVSDGKTKIMLECGIKYDSIQKALNYNLSDISACLISHAHSDHSLSCDKIFKAGIDLYMGNETAAAIKNNKFIFNDISDKQQFEVGTFIIIPFENYHLNSDGSGCECFGFLIYSQETDENLLFATDTAFILNRFKNLDYIMIEVNYIDDLIDADGVQEMEKRRLKSHMSLNTAIDFLKATDLSKVKQIYALHLSKDRCDAKAVLKALQMVTGKEVIVCDIQ